MLTPVFLNYFAAQFDIPAEHFKEYHGITTRVVPKKAWKNTGNTMVSC